MIETGVVILKIDKETNKKYWRIKDNNSKDSFDLEVGSYLEFSPEKFEEGTEIKLYEKLCTG